MDTPYTSDMLLVCLTSGFDLGFLLLTGGHSPTREAQGTQVYNTLVFDMFQIILCLAYHQAF